MGFSSGLVSVGTSATPICTPGQDGVLVQNLSAADVTIGGPGVTAGQGLILPASVKTPVLIRLPGQPEGESSDGALYGIVASSTANVSFLTTS